MGLPDFKTPWFITTMATGISTSILYNFPYQARWLEILAYIMFALCSLSLPSTHILFMAQVVRSPHYRHQILFDIQHNVFLGCGAMGFTSWVTALHLVSEHRVPMLSYVLWWISNLYSLFTCWIIFFCMLHTTDIKIESLSGTILLPIVALMVTSACGGVIAPSLPTVLQHSTIILHFLFWANAVGLAFILLTVYIHKLVVHKLPPRQAIFTSFIPIGFMGQGAFSVQLFGKNYHDYILSTDSTAEIQAQIFQYVSVLAGLLLQSLGFCFTFLAIACVVSYGRHQFHYGWWAMTFPLGTMSIAARETGVLMDWETFRVISAMYGVTVLLITSLCLCMSGVAVLRWCQDKIAEKKKKKAPCEESVNTAQKSVEDDGCEDTEGPLAEV